jgi:O-antigen/teichoic acid export membrane protein
MVLLVGGYLVVLGPEFLEVWLGNSYTPRVGLVMQILMGSFFFFLPMRGVALPVLMGIGKTKGPGFGLLAMGLTNLTLSLALVGQFGIFGVAFGTAVPNVVFSVIFLYLSCKHLGVSIDEYLRYVVQRSVLGALPALLFLLALKQWVGMDSWLLVLSAGVAYTAIFITCQLFFVYKGDQLTDPLGLIKQKLEARKS